MSATLCSPMDYSLQALSMELSGRQVGLPMPTSRDLPNGEELISMLSKALLILLISITKGIVLFQQV